MTYDGDHTNAGTVDVMAAYPGDENHLESVDKETFEIAKAPSTVVVTCPTAPIVFTGSAIKPCAARVSGVGGLDQDVTPVAYTANTAVGTALAEATYDGDGNHHGSTGSATFEIAPWSQLGFYKPVDMIVNGLEVVNVVKGGSTVPLKFNVFAGTSEVTDAGSAGGDLPREDRDVRVGSADE